MGIWAGKIVTDIQVSCMRPLGHYPPQSLWGSINILASWIRGHRVREIAELAQSHKSGKYRNQDFTHRSISKPCSLPWRRASLSCGGDKRLELHDIGYLSWCWIGSEDLRESHSVCHTKESGAHTVRECGMIRSLKIIEVGYLRYNIDLV